jgi:hypothetical protein
MATNEKNTQKKGNHSKKKNLTTRQKQQKLLSHIMKGESQRLIYKVAHILNQFPKTRNSDITLTIYLLKTFYPDFVRDERFALSDLYKLPKFYDMQRERARIQNQCGLFEASPEVKLFRKKHQATAIEEFAANQPNFSPVFVFVDESGTTGEHLIIGSLWLYSSNEYHAVINKLNGFEKDTDEYHFKKIKNMTRAKNAAKFFDSFIKIGCFSSFQVLILKNAELHANPANVYNGLAEMLVDSSKFELESKRIHAPIALHVIKDKDRNTDVLQMAPLNRRVLDAFNIEFADKSVVLGNNKIESVDSERSNLIQVVDIFTGAVNRWINEKITDIEKDPKDWLANYVGTMMGWQKDNDGRLFCEGDKCKIIYK